MIYKRNASGKIQNEDEDVLGRIAENLYPDVCQPCVRQKVNICLNIDRYHLPPKLLFKNQQRAITNTTVIMLPMIPGVHPVLEISNVYTITRMITAETLTTHLKKCNGFMMRLP
jgi:hypothetical protein